MSTLASLLRDARRKAEACERAYLAGPSPVDCDNPHPFACGSPVGRCLVSTNGGPQCEGGWWVEPLLPSQAHLDAHIAAAWQASLASVAGEAFRAGAELGSQIDITIPRWAAEGRACPETGTDSDGSPIGGGPDDGPEWEDVADVICGSCGNGSPHDDDCSTMRRVRAQEAATVARLAGAPETREGET